MTNALRLRIGYLENNADGLPILNPVAPDPAADNRGFYLLEGAGRSRYRQFEATARLRLAKERGFNPLLFLHRCLKVMARTLKILRCFPLRRDQECDNQRCNGKQE